MELAFADKEIRALCLSGHLAEERLDHQSASSLRHRLADLSAMDTASELFGMPGGAKKLGKDDDRCLINIRGGYELFFESGHSRTSRLVNGTIDWSKVRRIKILGVEKCND